MMEEQLFDEIDSKAQILMTDKIKLYKHSLEYYLATLYDFTKYDDLLESFDIPSVEIADNLYLKYSILGSKYIYFRNDINLDKLSKEDMNTLEKCIQNKEYLSEFFIRSTFKDVIFEDSLINYGPAMDQNIIRGDALTFELAYNQRKLTNIDQLKQVRLVEKQLLEDLKEKVGPFLNCEVAVHRYNSICQVYNETNSANRSY